MGNPVYEQALKLLAAGIAVIPIAGDGTKAPHLSANHPCFKRAATQADIDKWFRPPHNLGLAILCGPVSGDVEVIDFDDPQAFLDWQDLLRNDGQADLLDELSVITRTPTGGTHLWYRCPDQVGGNQKLARRPKAEGGFETLIETRGRGGYALAPPSPANCHELRRPYVMVAGKLADMPTIAAEERHLLLMTARALNEYVEPARRTESPRPRQERVTGDLRPGDDYNRRGDWKALLAAHGWKEWQQRGETGLWCRPGKEKGISATLGAVAPGILYVFSSNALPLESERSYDLFGAYCVAPETRILTADLRWVRADEIAVEDELVGVDEYPLRRERGCTRALRVACVEAADRICLPCYRIEFEDGRSIIASEDHCWLTKSAGIAQNTRWIATRTLKIGQRICAVMPAPAEAATDYDSGWLAGMFDGEGNASQHRIELAQNPGPIMDRAEALLRDRGYSVKRYLSDHKVERLRIDRNADQLRLLSHIRPERLISKRHWVGRGVRCEMASDGVIAALTFLGQRPVVAMKTSSHTFIAEGLVSHNCALEHGGDFRAAGSVLAAQGFGSPPSRNGNGHAPPPLEEWAPPADEAFIEDEFAPLPDDPEGDDLKAKAKAFDQLKYARLFAHEFAQDWMYLESEQWWQYQQTHWVSIPRAHAETAVQRFLMERREIPSAGITPSKRANVLALAEPFLGPVRVDDLNSNYFWIPLANGVYDVETGRMVEHSPAHRLTRVSSFDFDPAATCPLVEKFFRESLITTAGEPCEEWVDFMFEWCGYCLLADPNRAQTVLLNVGDGGNGKGVFEGLLRRLVGAKQCCTIDVEQLHDPYQRAQMVGRLVGFISELPHKGLTKNGGVLKAISGGDAINARNPTEKVFTFLPTTRLVTSCNRLPATRDLSRGFFRRPTIIEWRNQVTHPNPNLESDLSAELPGFFNLCMAGVRRLMARNWRFPELAESAKLLAEYRHSQDTVAQYLEARCEVEKGDTEGVEFWTTGTLLHKDYSGWCKESGYQALDVGEFGKYLTKEGFGASKVKKVAGKAMKIRPGIRVLSIGDEGLF